MSPNLDATVLPAERFPKRRTWYFDPTEVWVGRTNEKWTKKHVDPSLEINFGKSENKVCYIRCLLVCGYETGVMWLLTRQVWNHWMSYCTNSRDISGILRRKKTCQHTSKVGFPWRNCTKFIQISQGKVRTGLIPLGPLRLKETHTGSPESGIDTLELAFPSTFWKIQCISYIIYLNILLYNPSCKFLIPIWMASFIRRYQK